MTTKAQVNVVMSDKALVKHLQKELARLESELRAPGPISSNCDYVGLLKKKDLQIEKVICFMNSLNYKSLLKKILFSTNVITGDNKS